MKRSPAGPLVEEPKQYRGDELFLMIEGGADIYHEYGFSQVMAAEYDTEGCFSGSLPATGLMIPPEKKTCARWLTGTDDVIIVRRTGQDIVTVIGLNRERTAALAEELVKKLNGV